MALNTQQYLHKINAENFNSIALGLFKTQYYDNAVYRSFVDALKIDITQVKEIAQIPFLPISFFKTHKVVTGQVEQPALIFESSGTTGDIPSRHFVADEFIYEQSLLDGFRQFYGDPADYAILALLPSYLERKNASLVHMAKVLMRESQHPANGFYLDEWSKLSETIQSLEAAGQKILLLGVTFALLDFADAYSMQLTHTVVMETGGMKGRKEEWTRQQVHDFLKQRWQLTAVHSEYGMTELLSQAYARANGIFHATHTFKALIRDMNDPLDVRASGIGCLNIIDVANIHSCSFIATDDIGKLNTDGSFEVLGRVDHAALRGCSLMVV